MRYYRAWPMAGAVLALLAGGAAAAPSQLAQAVTRPPAAPASPNPSSTTNVLTGVSATSASNAWAVGYFHNNTTADTDTLALHWNGTTWKQAVAPSPGPVWNFLYAVSATSATNAWAVGYYVNKAGTADDTLALHWNGTTWKQVATPSPSSSSNHLYGVWASSASNAWAVGQYRNNTTGETDTLVLHWNGTAWKKAASANPSPGTQDANTLGGVAGTSASNIWAAGFYYTSTNTTKTLVLHWNGTAWKKVSSPSPATLTNNLYGVAATSDTNAWAAGQYTNNTTGVDDTLALHWNGTAWKKVASPNAGSLGNALSGVTATSASNAWAAGDSCTNVACTFSHTLILHWNGTVWSQAKSPNPSSAANVLSAVTATSASNAWAAGYYDNNSTGARDTLILHWNGVSWSKT
jgi:hypothetical protein